MMAKAFLPKGSVTSWRDHSGTSPSQLHSLFLTKTNTAFGVPGYRTKTN
jgi:hypothetical protein